jgi:transcriptional regulator
MDLLHGTLDMLVLRTLVFGPLHGYAIAQAIRTTSDDGITIEFGSLYPALKRLELKGWITARWETSEKNRRARVYRLTPAGRRQLRAHESEWTRFVGAVARVMKPLGGKASS